jgi:predicted permease
MKIGRYFRRRDEDAELAREIEAHIAHETDENVARGMTGEEAQRWAQIKFGSARNVREDVWEWNTVGMIDDLWRDLRYVLRTLRRAPGFALAVIVVMALGIGAVTGMFTIVRSVLLKPLPFPNVDRLVRLYEMYGDQNNVVAGGMFQAWRKEAGNFEQIAAFRETTYNLSGAGGQLPEEMNATMCSWNFFSTLGVQPVLGRSFDATDDRPTASATAILSWGLWNRRFSSDPDILGKSIQLDSKPYTVIGVMPEWFAYPDAITQAWTPIYHETDPASMQARDIHQMYVVALLKDAKKAWQGRSEIDTIEKRIHTQYPDEVIGTGANLRPLMEDMVGDYKTPLYALLAATGCVLLIACLNVANLFVARAAARRKEYAIRSAMGGSGWRLVREQLMESQVLSLLGGAIGLELAYAGVQWVAQARQDLARANAIHIDWMVIAVAAGLTVLSGIFAGTISARSSRGEKLAKTLQESGRTHSGGRGKAELRKILLSAETALTVMLLIAAGLLLKSYESLRTVNMGCVTKNVLTMRISLPDAKYKQTSEIAGFFERLIRNIRQLPQVDRAGLVSWPPGTGHSGNNLFSVVEHPPLPKGEFQNGVRRFADPGYFEAMGIPLLRGRIFREGEWLGSANVVIISKSLADRFFSREEEPIGQHLRVMRLDKNEIDYEVVGVVGDTRHHVADPPDPTIYYPIYSGISKYSYVVVRSQQDVRALALPIQKLIAHLDPDLAVANVLTMDQVIGKATTSASFSAGLTLGFAGLSLALAAVGLYGVLSYLVAQRTNEIGVRMALGAQRGQVLRLALADGIRPAILGLAFGLAGGLAAGRLIRNLLYGVQPTDASVFVVVAVLLLGVAVAACLMPALRASRLDPVQALRME